MDSKNIKIMDLEKTEIKIVIETTKMKIMVSEMAIEIIMDLKIEKMDSKMATMIEEIKMIRSLMVKMDLIKTIDLIIKMEDVHQMKEELRKT